MQRQIIIPWRDSGCAGRRKAFDYIYSHMKDYDPIIVDDNSKLFSRGGSRNLGAGLSDSDVFLFLDADMFVPHSQIDKALLLAKNGSIVQAFTKFYYLTQTETESVYLNNTMIYNDLYLSANFAVGGAICMTKEIFFDYGGYDNNFSGWGYEDSDLLATREKAGISIDRIEGSGVHLWHSREEKKMMGKVLSNKEYFMKKHHGGS